MAFPLGGGGGRVHLQDISVLQKKAIQVVTINTYKSHTEPILKEYGLLNVND